jgi:uncharacterized protein YndB with AHSA1/START domain
VTGLATHAEQQKPRTRPADDLPRGTVEVSVVVPGSPDDVWAAITERDLVADWFGNLSGPLDPGSERRLDFGDGDFFDIEGVSMDPPRRLAYHWRFLGVGARNAISWSIDPVSDGCRVTVTDAEDNRTPEGVEELARGWTDFLERLLVYRTTGQNARYDWRREFDGAVELPLDAQAAAERLLPAKAAVRWMPWSAPAIAAGAVAAMTDGKAPARLVIEPVSRPSPLCLRFGLSCDEWQAPTECTVQVEPRRDGGAVLVVSHTGWEAISGDEQVRSAQRTRFGTLWTSALRQARSLLSH